MKISRLVCPATGKRCYIRRSGQIRLLCVGCINYEVALQASPTLRAKAAKAATLRLMASKIYEELGFKMEVRIV